MDDRIYCPKCGAEMSRDSRYCMNCGTLNYEHEANKNMRKFLPKQNKGTYEIGSGKFMFSGDQNQVYQSVSTKTGNKLFCFLLHYFLYLGSLIIAFFLICRGNYGFESIVQSLFPLVAIIISLFFFYVYTIELLYMKCNKPWWSSLIPIYHLLEFSDIVFHKKWIGFLLLVPVVGQLLFLFMLYQLGRKFDYNGFLIALVPFIGVPMLSFGIHPYEGYLFVGKVGENELEKEYRMKKIFLSTFFLIFFVGIGCFLYQNFQQEKNFPIKNYYYAYVAKSFVKKVKSEVSLNDFTCRDGYSMNEGTYYFAYSDLHDFIFIPFYSLQNIMGGYVKLEHTMDGDIYSVYISDGLFGFSEVLDTEIEAGNVTEQANFSMVEGNVCTFH